MGSNLFYMDNEKVCTRRSMDGNNIRSLFVRNGWQETKRRGDADIILINTCAFIEKAENRAVKDIEKAVREKKDCQEIAVIGCLPGNNPERLQRIHQGISMSGKDLEEVAEVFKLEKVERTISHEVERKGPFSAQTVKWLNRMIFKDDYFTYLYDKKKVFHLQISQGCRGRCTYCSERLVNGSLKSKRISEIMEEFQKGLDKGYRIFSLNADDVGLFGQDNQENIAELLSEMLQVKKDFRLVLTEFNPWALLKYRDQMIELLSSPKIIFITVPIESGSQNIIKAMRRPYSVEMVMSILAIIKGSNPKLKINTHIIVGFPGETERDFTETIRLFDLFYFNKVKVFEYSERKGTEAIIMKGKVPQVEIKRRQEFLKHKVFFQAIRKLDLKAIILNYISF